MRVFKFGGASVKDANAIANIVQVLEETNFNQGIMVVSAMGKTTNALEKLVQNYMDQKNYKDDLKSVQQYHEEIIQQLFENPIPVSEEIQVLFDSIENFISYNKSENYNYIYDQIVSTGELASTKIISAYLNEKKFNNTWLDSRKYIKTDNSYREGIVQWKETESKIKGLDDGQLYVCQGFIASDKNNFSVTLGREGSDYSAAIFAYCLDAESMTIWKDVPGVLNADPRYFENATLLNKISYQEAVEMAFYGASVIHPKTLKPLENKNIPFYVRSFLHPEEKGTEITKGSAIEPYTPCFILKQHQYLIEVSPLDFSFITENHISEIFEILSESKLKTSLMQISAISLNLCIEDKFNQFQDFLDAISQNFEVHYKQDVSLYTVRHFNEDSLKEITEKKKVLLEQIVKETLQVVVQ